MLKNAEAYTNDLPVVETQEETQFTATQIIYMNENLNNYEPVALLEVNAIKNEYETLYEAKY